MKKTKALQAFLEEFKLQQMQLTLEVLGKEPRPLVAATFDKKISEDARTFSFCGSRRYYQ